ncbi:MAG: histidinol dehydrogenase [Lentisphaeria bacterium]|nr:histidinol dehydrogenase [Lentisphaeria bacterium]
MEIIRLSAPDYRQRLTPLLQRSAFDPVIDDAVAGILAAVRANGDAAVADCAEKFDGVRLSPRDFRVTSADLAEAEATVDAPTREMIAAVRAQIAAFARQRLPEAWHFSPRPGVVLGEQFAPLDRVGCYVPGGTAPLISTVLHTVTLAATAGVKDIVVVTPPGPQGKVNPAILHACRVAGATEVYRLGGVYAVAALAYGTMTIPKVEKIVGPGNAYVTAAKRQLYGEVALDLVAGPSEIMIIADHTADPRFIAADMLSQAEHGSGREQAVLVSTAPELLEQVRAELLRQSAALSRAACVKTVLDKGVFLLEAADLDDAADLASRYAPEHLELMVAEPTRLAPRITAAGAIFLGPWTPEPVGDFVAGPSHVLPTGGAAKFFSGLTIEHFFRRMSLVSYDQDALARELPMITCLAGHEGLDAHGNAAAIRRQK